MSNPLEFVLAYANQGFAVFPLRPRRKEPSVEGGFKAASRDETQIREWWNRSPKGNVGIATGAVSGLIVVDIDGPVGEKLLADLEVKSGALPPTPQVITGKGRHLYFKLPSDCGRVLCSAQDSFDIRADGGYVVAPPSIHPHGAAYRWAKDSPVDFAVAPSWLVDFARDRKTALKALRESTDGSQDGRAMLVAGESEKRVREGLSELAKAALKLRTAEAWSEAAEARLRSALAFIPAAERDRWLKVGAALHDLAKEDVRWPARKMWDEWSATSPEKFNSADQDGTWASFDRNYDGPKITVASIYHLASEAGWNPAPILSTDSATPIAPKAGVDISKFLRTDAGNALLFLALFGKEVRFVEKWGCWLVWNGVRWVECSDVAMLPLARRTTEEMLKWAVGQPNTNSDRDSWFRHAFTSQKDARLRAMIGLAKGEASNRIQPADLDTNLMLLGCQNGVIELRTGLLREARREDYITKQIAAAFYHNAKCERWLEFLNWAFQGDNEEIGFIQRLFGYVLTGEVSEEIMCVFVGDGANGKSTLLMTMLDVMGEYAGKAQSDLLVHAQGKEGAASPDVAALQGKRLVVVSETDDGCLLSEARIKDIVSNERIAARRLHRDPFEFKGTHKVILATNHKPRVRGTDNGIWRRLAIVKFDATIHGANKIIDFRERMLRPEMPGILRWAVEGCLMWLRDGLKTPTSVKVATDAYRADMDTVAQWIDERAEREASAVTPVSELFSNYKVWADLNHLWPLGMRRFGGELDRQGSKAHKLPGGTRARLGLKLRPTGFAMRAIK